MKLFVQIPCLNEEATLPLVLASIPREIPGIDEVHVVVVDDGSTDRTVEVARALGVRHIVRHTRNMGLARSFRDGVDYALRHGADIVVNTDGDNQYPQERIGDLVAPILRHEADVVVGDRQTATIAHFSPFKKLMQRVGSKVVSVAAGTSLPDAASGFRAYSRAALLRLTVLTQFSYTMETIIQAGNKRMRIVSVPITTNPRTRESRLFKNIWQHMGQSGRAIARSYVMYRPYGVFLTLGGLFGVAAVLPLVRFLVKWLRGEGAGHVQSVVFGSSMLVGSLLCFALLVIADLLRTNRTLAEEILERTKAVQYGVGRAGHDDVVSADAAAEDTTLTVPGSPQASAVDGAGAPGTQDAPDGHAPDAHVPDGRAGAVAVGDGPARTANDG
ncbi:glycosyltransferase family 2 protein [Xylanimonas oleitrophica]|uniref:Glycosyltransferase family 2 protein n=1 Tax=Xylanimonas oleitrophica TaxID=2607479 RepID=A0A2W5WT90_9MICO|nr:glycosyltransferase family 2 protein [Xylanimonas oleitrophica]PZR54360.1 glycosyltransferase family 2 protein [Xylanimonas oleitrophica]